MSDIEVKNLGTFPNGAKPPPLEHQYLDQNDEPLDISSGTWSGQGRAEQLHLEGSQPSGIGSGSVAIDVPTAVATYDWADEDFETKGRFRLIIWIGNGTQRFGSTVYEWQVADAPGVDPTV